MKQNLNDPVIDEIREVRHRISARFGHDPAQLVSFYLEMQKQYQDRLIETAQNTKPRDRSSFLTRRFNGHAKPRSGAG